MCLAVPGKIIDIYTSGGLRMGKIDFGGVLREACLESLPEAEVGEYTIVHAGFALSVLSEEDAQITLSALREIAALDEELGSDAESVLNTRTSME
jgi:hydrogenase expression/formation protein HypC